MFKTLDFDLFEDEKGSAGIAAVLFLLVLISAVILSSATYRLTIAQSTAGKLDSDVVGTSTPPRSVAVTASVLPSLGAKRITTDQEETYYLVYGNVDSGFSVLDQKNNSIIFGYEGMPGEGVLVPINNRVKNIIFIGKY